MSLDFHLSADAVADLLQIDPWLQEEVLDELERLAAHPDLIPPPMPGWGTVHAFVRASGTSLYVITLTLNRSLARLNVLGVRVVTSD